MADGLINYGLLDPKLASSFSTGYKEAEDRRNELALRAQQLQHATSQNELSKYTLSSAKQADEQQMGLNALIRNPSFNIDDPASQRQLFAFGPAGVAVAKSIAEQRTAGLTATKVRGDISAQQLKEATEKHNLLAANLAPLAAAVQGGKALTHDDVFGVTQNLISQGLATPADLTRIPQRVEDLGRYVMGVVTGNEKAREGLTKMLPEAMLAGGQIVNKNPLAANGIGARLAGVSMTPFQQAQLPIMQQTANARLLQAQTGVTREERMGQGPVNVSLSPEQNDALFGEDGAVAKGKINPNRINSRNAKLWADAFLKNPNADPVKVAQDVTTADKAIKDFGTGPQGVKITAFNTAIDHLDTLLKLGEAMKSGDIRAFNTVANVLGVQTGQPMATMYNQAAKIVGSEISKAIVPGVGTGKEREETASAFSAAMSPDQLKGADTVAKRLLGGQLASLEQQYKRTTKRNDFAEQLLSPAGKAAYMAVRPAAPAQAASGVDASNKWLK